MEPNRYCFKNPKNFAIFSLLFFLFIFGCTNQETQPETKTLTCSIKVENCVYDETASSLSCGSNYGVLSKGKTYWIEKCKNLSIAPKLLISLFGPFVDEAEYNESVSQVSSNTTIFFLYTESGTYKINNETSQMAILKKASKVG